MKTFNLLICILMTLPFISSCNNDDYEGLRFEFDTEGLCYLPSAPDISQADFQKYIVGHAWGITESSKINEKGELESPKSEIADLGTQYTTYYFMNDTIAIDFYRIKSLGYKKGDYNYSPEKSLLTTPSKEIHRIVYVGEKELVTISHLAKNYYSYNTYRKLTDEELEHYKENYTENFNDIDPYWADSSAEISLLEVLSKEKKQSVGLPEE